ncbi:MAG: tetratricopeptide repeat protein, partial [Ruminococcus sp.]|nr:tetratricopeptide repeat protein [Candidatus Apopatosoma intestinale]
KKYSEAITAFKALNGYKDSKAQIDKCNTAIMDGKYNAAMELYNAKKYSEAITAFKALNGYKDSKAQIDKCNTVIMDGKYNAAMELYNAKKYSEAITAFKALNGYKDSKAQIDKCNTAIMDGKYNAAMELYNAKKYSEAITAFKALNGYKDSAKQIENCYISKFGEQKWNTIKNLKIGDTFTFGKYEQDNNTSNGKEEIEWVVLDKDGLSILLISKFGLDCKQYEMSGGNTTWENCTLRKWLNSNFLNEAFSADETAIIQSSYVIADKNPKYDTDPGNDTLDKLFILSIKEAMQYIDNDEMWKCVATKYTSKKRVAEKVVTVGSPATCWWWLRSPGFDQSFAAYVDYYGAVSDIPVYAGSAAVRPAMWINLDS